EAVPHMGVAMHNRDVASGVEALEKPRRPIDELVIEAPALGRQAVAHAICERGDLLPEAAQELVDRRGVAPAADRGSQTRVVPPVCMEMSPCPHNRPAVVEARRQRPRGYDLMGLAEVFEDEPPTAGLLIPLCLEAPWENAWRGRGRHFTIEGDF